MPSHARLRLPLFRLTGVRGRVFVVLALLSAGAGISEAAILVVIVQIALWGTTSSQESVAVEFVPIADWALSSLFVLAVCLCMLRFVFAGASAWLGSTFTTKVTLKARKLLFSGFARARWQLQAAEEEGRLQDLSTTRMIYAGIYALAVAAIVTSGMNFVMLLGAALVVNPLAALSMVTVGTVLFVVLRPLSRLAKQQAAAHAAETTEYGRSVSQAVNLALESRVFSVTRDLDRRLRAAADRVAGPYLRAQLLTRVVPIAYQSLALLMIVGALWFIHRVELGAIAGIGAVIVLLIRSLSYGQLLQTSYAELQFYLPYAQSVEDAILEYQGHEMRGGTVPTTSIDRLELADVGFSYDGSRKALDRISFTVERGEIVGIAGPSGAGKSTLVEILLRLREPTSGRYLVNGVPAPELDLESWFARLAIVRQEPRLLTGTVEENIRFLRDGVDDAAVVQAAMLAHLHDAIRVRPGGYKATVGERGSALSGGQRQRLTIARAIVGSPELVVLDEPTSALDLYAESVIHETLDTMRGRATVFVIAHRPSTLRICDRIMVLDEGRLQAFDTPAALARSNTFFKRVLELSRID